MATPSVSAILGTPEFAASVDACTELFPGVPASKENLQPLWEYLCSQHEKNNCLMTQGDHTEVMLGSTLRGTGRKSVRKLFVRVEGPIEPARGPDSREYRNPVRAWVDDKSFDWSIDGFVEALYCARCSMEMALGGPPVKKARQ